MILEACAFLYGLAERILHGVSVLSGRDLLGQSICLALQSGNGGLKQGAQVTRQRQPNTITYQI